MGTACCVPAPKKTLKGTDTAMIVRRSSVQCPKSVELLPAALATTWPSWKPCHAPVDGFAVTVSSEIQARLIANDNSIDFRAARSAPLYGSLVAMVGGAE